MHLYLLCGQASKRPLLISGILHKVPLLSLHSVYCCICGRIRGLPGAPWRRRERGQVDGRRPLRNGQNTQRTVIDKLVQTCIHWRTDYFVAIITHHASGGVVHVVEAKDVYFVVKAYQTTPTCSVVSNPTIRQDKAAVPSVRACATKYYPPSTPDCTPSTGPTINTNMPLLTQAPNSPPAPLHLSNPDQAAHHTRTLLPTTSGSNTNARWGHNPTVADVLDTCRPDRATTFSKATYLASNQASVVTAVRSLVEADAVAFDRRCADAGCRLVAGTAHAVEAAA